MSFSFGLSMSMAMGNNCTVGNENDSLGLLYLGVGWVEKILMKKEVCE